MVVVEFVRDSSGTATFKNSEVRVRGVNVMMNVGAEVAMLRELMLLNFTTKRGVA